MMEDDPKPSNVLAHYRKNVVQEGRHKIGIQEIKSIWSDSWRSSSSTSYRAESS
jgi:hypothetical protein